MCDGGYGNAKLGSIGNKVAQKVQRHCCSRAVVIVKAVRVRTHDLGARRKVRVHLHQELVKNLKIKSFRLGIVPRVLFISCVRGRDNRAREKVGFRQPYAHLSVPHKKAKSRVASGGMKRRSEKRIVGRL